MYFVSASIFDLQNYYNYRLSNLPLKKILFVILVFAANQISNLVKAFKLSQRRLSTGMD